VRDQRSSRTHKTSLIDNGKQLLSGGSASSDSESPEEAPKEETRETKKTTTCRGTLITRGKHRADKRHPQGRTHCRYDSSSGLLLFRDIAVVSRGAFGDH
jgi:hypothetical protein